MRRKAQFAPEEFYHIYGRGNNKRNLFLNNPDYVRFLFLILFFQFDQTFLNVKRAIDYYLTNKEFNTDIIDTASKRLVEIVSFALMPNHFHLLLYELEENGISRYMQRVLDAYAKYFNTKHEQTGHLFEGPFGAVHVADNIQLLYLSAYIHKNPKELAAWKNREHLYPWSSYQDYTVKNRWGSFLKPEYILEQFSDNKEYKEFLKTSVAKEIPSLLFD